MNSPSEPHEPHQREFIVGLACAVGAHTLWGLFPLYWRLLSHVNSLELVWHRILWSFVLLGIVVPGVLWYGPRSHRDQVRAIIKQPRVWGLYSVAAVMIAINWFAFILAVNQNRVLEASLGYYINPLLNVLLGVVVLGERLARPQWIAVTIAAVGVAVMSLTSGGVPWIAFAMAISFALYGLVKKRAPLPPLEGLLLELTILVVPAILAIGWRVSQHTSALSDPRTLTTPLLIGGGVVTVAPLALFAVGVRRVDLSTVGILQYVGPTLQFLVGAFAFGEPLHSGRLAGFALVWIGLVVFVAGPLRRTHENRRIRKATLTRHSTPE